MRRINQVPGVTCGAWWDLEGDTSSAGVRTVVLAEDYDKLLNAARAALDKLESPDAPWNNPFVMSYGLRTIADNLRAAIGESSDPFRGMTDDEARQLIRHGY